MCTRNLFDASTINVTAFNGPLTGPSGELAAARYDTIVLYRGYDAQTVAHEFGHLLGFATVPHCPSGCYLHSGDPLSVMYPTQHFGPPNLNASEAMTVVQAYR
ncbi:MAG TPA: hypothetical protein VJX67_09130 [Blastocatellia bacterium]|nr:hypothetical protein [Blastocatellia bacterium]